MAKTILSLTLFLFVTSTAVSQEFAKYAGEFMAGGAGSRYLGSGNNAVAHVNDAWSVYWNPAGLNGLQYAQAGFMHNERFGGLVKTDFFAMGLPWKDQYTIGFGVLRNGIDELPDTRDGWDYTRNRPKDGFVPSYFNAAEYVVYGSLSAGNFLSWPVGVTAKYIYRSYGDVAGAWGVGFDIGTQKHGFLLENLSVGFVARDVTSTLIAWDSGTTELIAPSVESAAAWNQELPAGRLLISAGIINRFENRRSSAQFNWGGISHDLKGGLEWQFRDAFALRAGYNELERVNLGAGIKLQSLWIDYAFESFSGDYDLGSSHRISVSLDLDKLSFKRNQE